MTDPIDDAKSVSYTGQVYQLAETAVFSGWLGALRDRQAKVKIVDRLKRAEQGNFGDHKSVGDGVFEMRVHHGPGYRVYYWRRGHELVVLLCGGDKSTQQADIAQARRLRDEIERRDGASSV